MIYKRRVVIESPYRNADPVLRARNITYARAAYMDALRHGEAPILSHLLGPQAQEHEDDSVEEERLLGLHAGLAWHTVADAVVFYTDLGWTEGMHKSLAHAREVESLHVPICRPAKIQIETRTIPGWTWDGTCRPFPVPLEPECHPITNVLRQNENLLALPRTPDGWINNCLLATQGTECDSLYGPCQMCNGTCPDRERLRHLVPGTCETTCNDDEIPF